MISTDKMKFVLCLTVELARYIFSRREARECAQQKHSHKMNIPLMGLTIATIEPPDVNRATARYT